MSTIVEVKGTGECNLPDFIRKEEALQNFKPSLGYGYHQFTKKEFISPNTEVVLKRKVCSSYYKMTCMMQYVYQLKE